VGQVLLVQRVGGQTLTLLLVTVTGLGLLLLLGLLLIVQQGLLLVV
jgi:hypothetical protein